MYTLLFDGRCRMCTQQADMIRAYDDRRQIELLDLHSEAARTRFPYVDPAQARQAIHLITPDGTVLQGVAAVRETLLRLPALRGLGELLCLPGATALAAPLYAFVARNRYLFGGSPDACDDGQCSPR